jgi:lipoprotein-anchoring transpeptidase ErfK/SrfK
MRTAVLFGVVLPEVSAGCVRLGPDDAAACYDFIHIDDSVQVR